VKYKAVYCIIFILLCCIPVFTMFFFSESSGAEKRELAEKPSLITEDNSINLSFPEEFENYLADNFSFRSKVVSSFSKLKYRLFNVSFEEQVIAGDDGWLYFSKTLDDYLGKNVFTEKELKDFEKTLSLIDEYAEKNGAEFIFTVAPNKNSIYPENMPYYYVQGVNKSNLDLLNEYLADKSYYYNTTEALDTSIGLIYHKTDTHWNNLGAAQCYNGLMEKLNKEHIDYIDIGYSVQNIWKADLNTMLFPDEELYDEQIVFDFEDKFEYTSRYRSAEDINISTECLDAEGSLLMFRDSFTNALLPLIANNYRRCTFTRVVPYRISELEKDSYDTVVIEIAERNLRNIIESAPVMCAPERNVDSSYSEAEDCEMFSEDGSGLKHFYGSFTGSDAEEIILCFQNGGDSVCYEAFPIRESDMIETAESGKNYFSLYVPSDVNCDNIKVYIK